jgi:hypothetical protein
MTLILLSINRKNVRLKPIIMTTPQNNIVHLFNSQNVNPIKEELRRQHKTIKWLALETGLSQTTINKAINGATPLQARSPKTRKICSALNIDLNVVNGLRNNKKEN